MGRLFVGPFSDPKGSPLVVAMRKLRTETKKLGMSEHVGRLAENDIDVVLRYLTDTRMRMISFQSDHRGWYDLAATSRRAEVRFGLVRG